MKRTRASPGIGDIIRSTCCCTTGIGKSIARKLASQGLNVVLVALQDPLLDETTAELSAAFPSQLMRKVSPTAC